MPHYCRHSTVTSGHLLCCWVSLLILSCSAPLVAVSTGSQRQHDCGILWIKCQPSQAGYFSHDWQKTRKSRLRSTYFGSRFEGYGQSLWRRKAWKQGHEAAAHRASAVRKQRAINSGTQFSLSRFLFSLAEAAGHGLVHLHWRWAFLLLLTLCKFP